MKTDANIILESEDDVDDNVTIEANSGNPEIQRITLGHSRIVFWSVDAFRAFADKVASHADSLPAPREDD